MSLSLPAPPPFRNAAPARQSGALLLASVALHAAILIPVALNTVFLPQWEPNDRTFEVWIEMPIAEPVRERLIPQPQPVSEQTAPQATDPLQETVVEQERPLPVAEPVRPEQQVEQQVLQTQNRTQLQSLDRQMPQLAPLPEAVPSPSELLNNSTVASPVSPLTDMPTINMSRPHIEAIDGPAPARDMRPLSGATSLPEVNQPQAQSSDANSRSGSDVLDAPVPRRARMTDEEEAALAAAAASGALDDAWVYRPQQGEQGGGWPPAGGGASTGGSPSSGISAGTATFRGTPVDCTQPQLLSDIQKLSCDNAEARRIRSAVERGVRVMGTGDAERDGRNASEGNQRLYDFERRRQPLRAGVGVSQGSMLGGSDRGEVLDEMSGTNREVEKLQDAMRRSNASRPPEPTNDPD